ncbi:hypothetical protein C0Q70_02701 [Pomacea canaliculata]|uniref:Uncharacterized protein n=1 Tax=Pomacea canaliculata TaxID=400727 RepID=A0A2T7PQP8_POMCA|nr:hypothetical protein C0Q70_02701 [Pomacea canaliculata]
MFKNINSGGEGFDDENSQACVLATPIEEDKDRREKDRTERMGREKKKRERETEEKERKKDRREREIKEREREEKEIEEIEKKRREEPLVGVGDRIGLAILTADPPLAANR